MIDVTVIVPAYNSEEYIKRCIDSLLEQDYDCNKMEIFIINDCSTDNTVSIIKEYTNKYEFITLEDLDKNHGVSYARNIGIRKAKGEYVMFCDSDDYYEKNAISTFMGIVKGKNADFIVANRYNSYDDKSIKINQTKCFSKDMITKKEIVSNMNLSSCSKIIKKDLFIKNNIYYPENIKKCEELPVIPIVAYLAQKPVAIDKGLYHYYQRRTSVSNTNNKGIKLEDLNFFDETFEMFYNKIDKDKYKEELEYRAIMHFIYSKILVMLKSKMKNKVILQEIKKFKQKYPNFIKNEYLKNLGISKRVFIYVINYKLLIIGNVLAIIHKKLTA